MIRQETKIKNTYWLEHKIIMNVDNTKEYPTIWDKRYSKQKNILFRRGTLENFYENT